MSAAEDTGNDTGSAISTLRPGEPMPGADPAVGPAPGRDGARRRNTIFVVAGLFVAFVLAGFVSGYASSHPDGLEKVAEEKGFLEQADDHAFADWPIADYAVSGIDNERLAGGVAGIIGVSIAFVVGGVLALGVVRLRARPSAGGSASAGPRSEPVPDDDPGAAGRTGA